MYHNVFTHLPTEGQLGCVQLGAVTSKAAVHALYMSFYGLGLSFLSGGYLELEWQGGRVGLCF